VSALVSVRFLFFALALLSSAALRTGSDDLVVAPSAWTNGVRVALHRTIRVAPPADYAEWRVQADGRFVRLLTSREAAHHPGAGGWRFAAVGRGETVVRFIPFVAASPDAPMQPVFRLKVTIE